MCEKTMCIYTCRPICCTYAHCTVYGYIKFALFFRKKYLTVEGNAHFFSKVCFLFLIRVLVRIIEIYKTQSR